MADRVVLDAGPLVALIDRDDQFHEWALARTRELAPKVQLVTCEPVVAEAYHLVVRTTGGTHALLRFLEQGGVHLDFSFAAHLSSVAALLRKYQDIPMSLADACLVRMSELHEGSRVFTLDSDFLFYRRHGRQTIPLITPACPA